MKRFDAELLACDHRYLMLSERNPAQSFCILVEDLPELIWTLTEFRNKLEGGSGANKK